MGPGCSPQVSRRLFLTSGAVAAGAAFVAHAYEPQREKLPDEVLRERTEGLLIGSFLGDALGGPIEFQEPARVHALVAPPKNWRTGELLDETGLAAAAARLRLRSYRDLRPAPEPYAHWTTHAEPGTVTDDSRHKMILMFALREAKRQEKWPLEVTGLAQAYLDWPRQEAIYQRPEYRAISEEWLVELHKAARWSLGERERSLALPTERLWSGRPTCCGQMTLPPLAALFPGDPEGAYLAAFHLGFFDNGWGKDLNAALLAGLAAALTLNVTAGREDEAWAAVFVAMRNTDPYEYTKVPWTYRSVDRWLDLALQLAKDAGRQPAKLFARLTEVFRDTIKWEAEVPFVVAFSALAICDYHPMAALQLSMEWGEDTDSYAQLLGAFIGALYGPTIFPADMRATVTRRLLVDYAEDVQEWANLLVGLEQQSRSRKLIATM